MIQVVLWCDWPGCFAEIRYGSTVIAALRFAYEAGWLLIGNGVDDDARHYCPTHAGEEEALAAQREIETAAG